MLADWHVHTCFSNDCRTPVDQVIEAAVKKGMKEICITDHCDLDLPDPGWVLDIPKYTKAMEEYREKYAGIIDIKIGIELGLNPKYKEGLIACMHAYPFDLVIGSTHTMLDEDPYYRKKYDMDDEEYYRAYLETSLQNVKAFDGYDSYGHLDYIVRYGYNKGRSYSPYRYRDIIDDILRELIKKGIALEVNTGGLRKGLRSVHPHVDILKRYKELGGRRITLGSDAHFAEHVGADFDRAEDVIRKLKLELI